MAGKPEIKVDKAVVYDAKLESAVKKTALAHGQKAATESLDGDYVVKLVPTLKLDEKAREIVATCKWDIFEGGGSRLFNALKQSKQSTASATVNPAKVTQGNLDDTVGEVCENEVRGISKLLKAMEKKKP